MIIGHNELAKITLKIFLTLNRVDFFECILSNMHSPNVARHRLPLSTFKEITRQFNFF